jgi:hypothetical protein
MVVVLPAPLGPRNPVTQAWPDREAQAVDHQRGPISLGEAPDPDHLARAHRPFGCHTRKPRPHHVAAHIEYLRLP